MEQIFPENWAILHLGMIFAITLAQMLVVYVLSDSSKPPAGLGLFTVYFMAALLGWIALTLRQGSDSPMVVDVPSVAAILNSYILFLAAGQRAKVLAGRWIFGAVCLVACLCVFFLPAEHMFALQTGTAALFFAGTMVVWRKHAHRLPFDPRGILCMECGYNLTGNVSGRCPECGTMIPADFGPPTSQCK